MKNIMRNKEVKLFAVIFAVFIASMMLFATTTHAATITTKNMPSKSVCVGSSKTLAKPNVSGFKWKAINNTYYTLTTAGKLTGKKVGTASFSVTCKNVKYVYRVTVRNKPKLNYTSKTAVVGDKVNLSVRGGTNVTWKIGNEKIVCKNITDGSTFKGSAFNVGTTTVTAKTAGLTLTCKVTVKPYNGSLVKKMAPMADTRLTSAFDTLGFKIKYETSLPDGSLGGCFNAGDGTITLTRMHINDDLDDTIYHELGHFLSFIAGHVDNSAEYKAIYNSEKARYRKAFMDSRYAVSSSAEYFAESYMEYVLEPGKLKSAVPKTYAAIQSSLKKITPERLEKLKQIYGPFWK